jgi:hypothetical protein
MVAETGGTIVANGAGLRRSLWVRGEIQPAFHMVDVMTDPAHRSGSTFLRVVLSLQRRLFDEGARYVFGFPNDNSRPFFRDALKWRSAGRASVLIRPLGTGRLWKQKAPAALRMLWPLSLGARFLPPWRRSTREVVSADPATLRPLRASAATGTISLHRTPEEFRHRFGAVPGREYRALRVAGPAGEPSVGGYVVTRVLDLDGLSLGVILDLEGETSADRRLLAASSVRAFASRGCDAALALAMPGDPIRRDYLSSAFFAVPAFIPGGSLELMVKERDDAEPAKLPWRVSWGLNDVF